MARIDTLQNFLTDVADAIRTKEASSATITASEFDTRITNLPGETVTENLSEELNTYDNGLEKQETTIADIISALETKGTTGSGGGCLGQPFPITNATGATFILGSLDSMTTKSISLAAYETLEARPNIALVFWFARSNCTISDNVTVIYEGEPVEVSPSIQRLYIGYTIYEPGKTITITQENNVRLGIGYIPLCNAGVPIVVDNQVITMDGNAECKLNTDENLNIFVTTSIYTMDIEYYTDNYFLYNIGGLTNWRSRLGCFITTCPIKDAKVTFKQTFYGDVVQIKCPALPITNEEV